MPRPTLRRTVSTPMVRQRASSNPYPPMSPITTRSMAAAMNATPLAPPPTIPTPIVTRSRRGMSTSSSSAPPTDYWSRRVLADITWCYDGQMGLVSSASSMAAEENEEGATDATVNATTTTVIAGDNIDLEDMERLSLGAPSGTTSIVEEDEFTVDEQIEEGIRMETPEPSSDPFALFTSIDSQPSSTNSSPAARRRSVARSVSLGNGVPSLLNLRPMHSRRESSFSSISSCSDFEDHVPSPDYYM